jgi:tRNA uridine 5-carboxymethylaminomethyl modification enzyme
MHTIPGLEEAEIIKLGYAVEYDFFYPYQLKFTMETKAIEGLFFAGQINGTSGYEEAASQGLIAGINAARKVKGEDEFTLQRSEAYIGVLIDDLVNKNTEEPYRVFTSLAEYRLLLRIDTVYDRLLPYGYDMGLVTDTTRNKWLRSKEIDTKILALLEDRKVQPTEVNPYLESIGEEPIRERMEMGHVTKRPTVDLRSILDATQSVPSTVLDAHPEAIHRVQTEARYAGYIKKQLREVERFKEHESKKIPTWFDFTRVDSLSTEAVEKLTRIRPATLGQASRIPGVSAADVSILSVYLTNPPDKFRSDR